LGKNAKVKHIRIVRDSDKAAYTQSSHVQLDRDANYECFTLTTGVGFTRHQVHVELNGQNGHASFDGLNLLSGKDHGDTTILIDHKAPHCTSNQFYRSLLNDKAHGIFQGKVHVFEGAQKTDGYQLSNAIILSETAQMDTKPELEIYADDVQCSHGATTGQLDDEPLFYLRSRGLSEKEAKQLLMQAFVGEVLDKIQNDDYRVKVDGYVDEWLKANL
jgi:Fe-S cluster assembly protein SufD